MLRVNINEAKTHPSRLRGRLRRAERIVICKRNVPIAEIVPLPMRKARARPIGRTRGEFVVPASVFEPLPEDELRAFLPIGQPVLLHQPEADGRHESMQDVVATPRAAGIRAACRRRPRARPGRVGTGGEFPWGFARAFRS